ncbi:MAG: ribosome assembly factor SBDS [Candidatus Woesearchaeota archaeon]
MVDVDKAIIARFKTQGIVFEVLVDCDLALALKGGQSVDMHDVLAVQKVFNDARKAMVAPENQLIQIFGTSDVFSVAKDIIIKGEVQITAEHRAKILEEKRKRILYTIHKNGVDPKTHLPHPITRLELAFEEAKIRIDEYQSEEKQIKEILKKLRPILPIAFEKKEVAVKIPPEFGHKAYQAVKNFGELKKDEWQNDGSWVAVVEIPAGLQAEFFEKLNSLTHGSVESKILKTTRSENDKE